MDSVTLLSFARKLIDIDSTTGQEGAVAQVLADELEALGYNVTLQALGNGRANVIATIDDPVVVFSTHFDCVPPFFPSRVEGGVLHGRGACDAKGILAAQVAAAERLRAEGESRIALVFVCGEERGSDGAKAANTIASQTKYLINGEPTELKLGLATRGCFRVRLKAHGRAAHSGYPHLGESAIEKLMDVLRDLRTAPWPSDPQLGTTHYTVGLISGGVAPNVIPPNAEAEVFFRTVGEHDPVREVLTAAVAGRVEVQEILELPAVRLHTVPGFDTEVFAYFSDVPFLTNWGTPLLLGPGTIHVAHTDHEHVLIADLDRAVDMYADLARSLLRP